MAKDDYNVIKFKILVYLYACAKRKLVFDEVAFKKAAGDINEEYLMYILRNMQDDMYIKGLLFVKAWGNEYILASSLQENPPEITSYGIEEVTDNDRTDKIKKMLIESADIIASLIKIVL